MRGKPRPRRPKGPRRRASPALLPQAALPAALAGLLMLLLCLAPAPGAARELRRQMPSLRADLMGDAYVAVADESSVLLYNPAGLARLKANTIQITPLALTLDSQLTRALLNPDDVKSEYQDLTPTDLAGKVNTSIYYEEQLRLPFLFYPKQGNAYGIGAETLSSISVAEDRFGLPSLEVEMFVDQTLLWSSFGKIGNVSLGITGKLINRAGLVKTLDAFTLYGAGTGLDLTNDSDYQNLAQGKSLLRGGLDLGMLVELPFAPDWDPRIGLSVLNLTFPGKFAPFTGIEFGNPPDKRTLPLYGDFPLNVVAGFAVSPTFDAVRYTFAMDMVDLAQTALKGHSLNLRTRVGLEIGIGPHEDGTALFSILLGLNATHLSVGFLSRVSAFEIGMGSYTVETGNFPGDNPQQRRLLIIGMRF